MNMEVPKRIFCFWTDDNPLTQNRLEGLKSMRENLGVPIEFLDKKGIEGRILPEAPLHPAYKYLSATHKSDYLRCYFMHFYGGGYADIKFYTRENNWRDCFDYINRHPEMEILGTRESLTGGRRPIYNTKDGAARLLVCGFFICRPRSWFTGEWYRRMLAKMDAKKDALKKHPARSPTERSPEYPMRWVELHGLIFHDLLFETSFLNPEKVGFGLIHGRDETKKYR